VNLDIPVVFTTAYNEYAIEAFKANGIDYLLKPITFEAVSESLEKFKALKNRLQDQGQSEANSS